MTTVTPSLTLLAHIARQVRVKFRQVQSYIIDLPDIPRRTNMRVHGKQPLANLVVYSSTATVKMWITENVHNVGAVEHPRQIIRNVRKLVRQYAPHLTRR